MSRFARCFCLILVSAFVTTSRLPGAESFPTVPGKVQALKITVLSTMLADFGSLGEWGFAALVEADGHSILFDTGAHEDVVRRNAEALKIDLSKVPEVVLSHFHGDHVTGFLPLRRAVKVRNPDALQRTHVGRGIFYSRPFQGTGAEENPMIFQKQEYEQTGGVFVEHEAPVQLYPGVWLTGPIPRKYPERNWSGNGKVVTPAGVVEDNVPDDMSLVLDTTEGLVVLTGCGHAGVVNIIEYARLSVRPARVAALIGGLHLFNANDEQLRWTADRLREFGVDHFLGAHCTGVETVYRFRQDLGLDRAHGGGRGRGIEFHVGQGDSAGNDCKVTKLYRAGACRMRDCAQRGEASTCRLWACTLRGAASAPPTNLPVPPSSACDPSFSRIRLGMAISGQFPDETTDSGEFARQEDAFREWISDDDSTPFAAESGRYHLYVSLACPWAHRSLIARNLKGLDSVIGVTVVDPVRDERGWAFRDGPGHSRDSVNGFGFLREAYEASTPAYRGRVTVPVLWDKRTRRIVNNSEDDLCRMFDRVFAKWSRPDVVLFPAAIETEHTALAAQVYERINNGVYRAGFATQQSAYERACSSLFEMLDRCEARLETQRFLFGSKPVEVDWRLFCTLVRFDAVYHGHFKCNLRRIVDYPNLQGYLCDLYQQPGIAPTVNLDHIKRHYYMTHEEINPTRIVPLGPILDFSRLSGRERLGATSPW